jgi:hypothetical protein
MKQKQYKAKSAKDEKAFSLIQVIRIMSVVVLVTFIIGTVFGLKIGSGSRNIKNYGASNENKNFYDKSSTYEEVNSTPRSVDAYSSQSVPSGSSTYQGRHSIDEYKPAAEDVARHWERETGQPTSDEDVRFIQSMMKVVDDKMDEK